MTTTATPRSPTGDPMLPADELRTAAQTLRSATFRGAMTATPAVAALVRTRQPLAAWLESWTGIDLDEAGSLPEDARHAIAVARAINGDQP